MTESGLIMSSGLSLCDCWPYLQCLVIKSTWLGRSTAADL